MVLRADPSATVISTYLGELWCMRCAYLLFGRKAELGVARGGTVTWHEDARDE